MLNDTGVVAVSGINEEEITIYKVAEGIGVAGE